MNMYAGKRYMAVHRLLATDLPIYCTCPTLLVRSSPVQLATESFAIYFSHYKDCITLQAFLEGNQQRFVKSLELDKFLDGLVYSTNLFIISKEERLSCDPVMLQKFT